MWFKEIARQSLRAALTLRGRSDIPRASPICIYDLAEKLGVKVRFDGGSSFGGMYARVSKTILVPALRPPGRQVFTCAHELGHWYFSHGTRVDELDDMGKQSQRAPEERLANVFASYLLMPPWAVEDAFKRRGWDPQTCSPSQFSLCAGQLGVGYKTLVQHLEWSLDLISPERGRELEKVTPKRIRQQILEADPEFLTEHLVVVDTNWNSVAVDLRMGDAAILPEDVSVEGNSIRLIGSHPLGQLIQAAQPGIARAETSDGKWAVFIRVQRREYVGLSNYRHLEDPDVELEA